MKGNLVYEISPPEYHRGRDDCEMCKTQEVDQPKHDHPANEGVMTDKEYADKDDGKKETEDWHHHPELEIVHQYSTNYNGEY